LFVNKITLSNFLFFSSFSCHDDFQKYAKHESFNYGIEFNDKIYELAGTPIMNKVLKVSTELPRAGEHHEQMMSHIFLTKQHYRIILKTTFV
jgi:hypothetical protein